MRRALLTLTIAGSLALAACGGDDDDAAETSAAAATTLAATTTDAATTTTKAATTTTKAQTTTTKAATTTTKAATTTTAAATTSEAAVTSGSYVPGVDADADDAVRAWITVFDSDVPYADKASHIADAEALRPTIEGYQQAGAAVGGIELIPVGVEVTGDAAGITYDVMFAGNQAYGGQTGTIQRVDGTWQVSREEFCGFMAAARNPCPAG
jgi:hypothetical protein